MEFRGFDDDLFSETEIKLKKTAKVDYQPKTVLPEWYTEKQALPPEDMEKAHFYIFRGNHDYYQGAWSSALEAYTRALDYIAPNNGSMRRLLCESLARCRWKCGDADGAVEMGKKLVEESTHDHQLFCAHSAMALFYDAAGNTKDQAESLRYCLDIRPLSSQHWIQLAKIYLQKIRSKDSRKFSTDHAGDNDLEVKRHIAEFDDNCSVGSVNSQCVSQRTDNNYSAKVEACPSATKASSAHNGDIHTRKGQEERRDIQTEQVTSLSNDEHILDNSPRDLLRNRLDRNPFPHGTCSNVSGDACESRNLNHKLESSSVASESFKPGPVSGARENIPRWSSASTVGPDNGTLEADKLERLSLTSEGFPEVKDLQSNGSGEGVDGGGDRAEEDDPFMQAVTCLLKAQVILKSLQICAVSLTKTRNAQLLAEIDGLLSTLHLDPAFLQDMSKKMYNEVFEKDIKEEETHGSC